MRKQQIYLGITLVVAFFAPASVFATDNWTSYRGPSDQGYVEDAQLVGS